MASRLKNRQKRHFTDKSHPTAHRQRVSDNRIFGQGFFKTHFQIPNHQGILIVQCPMLKPLDFH